MNLIKHSAQYLEDPKTSSEEIVLRTVKKYVTFLAPTYGPAGKQILIAPDDFTIKSVDDGNTASKYFEMEDELPQAVVKFIRETTQKTDERVGDGTTTSALIMGAIVENVLKNYDDPFKKKVIHAEVLKIKKAAQEVVKAIQAKAKKIKTKEELYQIAYNSYNNEEIAKIISDTIHKIGKDGSVTIEDSNGTDVSVEVVKGLEFKKGYSSPYFISNPDRGEAKLNKPYVLLSNDSIEFFKDLFPIIKQVLDSGRKEILIIADSFSQEVMNQCIIFKIRGDFNPLLIQTPGYGDNKAELLKDIASVVNAEIADQKTGKELKDIKLEHLGTCESIISTKDKSVLVGGKGNVQKRVDMLKLYLEASDNKYDNDSLKERIAALTGGVAVIKVGAPTENEQKTIKAKVEDAVNATKVAFKDGVVPGAGKTFEEIKTDSEVLNAALKEPRKQLLENGAEFLDENVVDPAGVLIAAFESAVSIGCGLIETGGIIAKKNEDKED